jgi:hypothetical protein
VLVVSHSFNLVAQYHRRLLILDQQIAHVNEQNLGELASLLQSHHDSARQRSEQSLRVLRECNVEEDEAAGHWKDQVAAQTKPISCGSHVNGVGDGLMLSTFPITAASQKNAEAFLQKTAGLIDDIEALDQQISRLESKPKRSDEPSKKLGGTTPRERLTHLCLHAERLRDELEKNLELLGREGGMGARQLRRAQKDPFVLKLLQCKALKQRVRQQVVESQFEKDKLHRKHIRPAAGELTWTTCLINKS